MSWYDNLSNFILPIKNKPEGYTYRYDKKQTRREAVKIENERRKKRAERQSGNYEEEKENHRF